ncbi:MAG: replicative DNA helicase [Pseudomonadota bacterium]|nr:replicative DNA helicase [Pseudomonadota bacterium]
MATSITNDNLENLKVPPHSIEAEQSVLGGLMLQNEVWYETVELVSSEDFYRKDHSEIYIAMQNLAQSNSPFDVVTLAEWLRARDILEKVGGIAYLTTLVDNTPSAANIVAYCKVVREKSILRELISASATITESVFNTDGTSYEDLIGQAESLVFKIGEKESRGKKTFVAIDELMSATLEKVHEIAEGDGGTTGVPTGFYSLDDMTSGLQPSDLIIVAGRPSMGKTAFAMDIAQHAAIKKDISVAIFSMEMPKEQIALRMLSSLSRISQTDIRTGQISPEDWHRLSSSVQLFQEQDVKMFIDDTAALNPNELKARCRRLKREKDIGLVIVDYLQLMQISGSPENRATEIAEISRNLKAMAREIECPVVALSQLNRTVEQRQDKRPVMSDLRESGAIEQDADLIMFIYRDEVYNEETTDKGMAEIIIGKHRNGPIGKRFLQFRGEFTKFENPTNQQYLEPENE